MDLLYWYVEPAQQLRIRQCYKILEEAENRTSPLAQRMDVKLEDSTYRMGFRVKGPLLRGTTDSNLCRLVTSENIQN